jgi:predicted transcriptional regulator
LELSKLITANPGTIRSKLKILEASGRIRSVPSINRQHQPVTKYYRD